MVESLVSGIWNYKPVARLAVDVEHTHGDEWTARRVVQCKDLLGHAIILKTEGVQSIVALAEAVKAFKKMTQFLGSVQVARHCRTLCDNLVAKTRAQLDHRHPLFQWLIVAATNDLIFKYPFGENGTARYQRIMETVFEKLWQRLDTLCAFRIVAINFGGYVFNNVVSSRLIQILSLTCFPCSTTSLSKTNFDSPTVCEETSCFTYIFG